MTKKQSVCLMNILAILLNFIDNFSLPSQFIHALDNFELVGKRVYDEMRVDFDQSKSVETFLEVVQKKLKDIISKESQLNMLKAYHICIWLDQMLTYEDVDESQNKLSIYNLIPIRAFSYIKIDALNDNYENTGIWINPKLPIFKTSMFLDDGTEKEKILANRDAFDGINGELRNISYCIWNNEYVVHNIIVPYEYKKIDDEESLTVGFIPISDRKDLIDFENKVVKKGRYKLNTVYVNHLKYQEIISERFKHGLKLACMNKVDIVFAPEMLGTDEMGDCIGNYNKVVHQIYGEFAENGDKPPLVTIMPTYWRNGVNSAAIIYRDGYVLGRQKKYMPYIDFKSCSVEGIIKEKNREIYLIHIYGVHRIAISICAEFIDSFNSSLICGQLGATLIIVPSFSHGERDFVNKLGTLFPYGTSVLWGDCCGAVPYKPRYIGGCSLVGSNEIYKMGNNCKCDFSCASCESCLFVIKLPLKIVYSKDISLFYEPIRHIML